MEGLSAKEVVLVPYPYSDLSAAKLRPAAVLARTAQDDLLLCQITSNPFSDPQALELKDEDFASGSLPRVSYARPMKLFTGNHALIQSQLGRLHAEAFSRIITTLVETLRKQME